MNFQKLLDSNDFLYYPKLSSDIFKAMESSDGIVVLDANYDEAISNLAKIGIIFKACIHTLCLNLSPFYSARFEQVKANILARDILHFNYFEKNNAFLNVPEISNLVFTLMSDPSTTWTIPIQPLPNEKTFYNRIAFAFSSLRHSINLKLYSSYSKKFFDTTKNITDIIQKDKEDKINDAKEKESRITKKKERYENAKTFLISTLKIKNKIVLDCKKRIEELKKALVILEDPNVENNSPSQLEINNKNFEIERIEYQLKLDDEIETINTTNETHEETIRGMEAKINKIKNEVSYKTAEFLRYSHSQIVIDELKVYNDTLLEHEKELQSSKAIRDIKLQELFTSKKDEASLKKEDSLKKIKKIKIEIEEIQKQLNIDLREKKSKIFELRTELKINESTVDNTEELINEYIGNYKKLYDKLIDETPDIFSPEIENEIKIAEKTDTVGTGILLQDIEDYTNEEKEPIEVKPEPVYSSTNPFATSFVIHEPKAEPILTKKTELLNIFNSYNKHVSNILESFLSRFAEDNILSIYKIDHELKIKLKNPMKLWVPKIDFDDPKGGSILLFNEEFHVKLAKKGFEFTKGFEVYSQVDKYGISKLVTANIYNILENQPNNFTIEAGIDIPLLGRQAEKRPIKLDQTIERWGSPNISEVVEGDHVEFLNKKLL